MSLAISGGVHEPLDAVKAVMAGAHVVQLVSTLLRHGPSRIAYLRTQFEAWAESHQYESLKQLQGVASLAGRADAASPERGADMSVLQSWPGDPTRFTAGGAHPASPLLPSRSPG